LDIGTDFGQGVRQTLSDSSICDVDEILLFESSETKDQHTYFSVAWFLVIIVGKTKGCGACFLIAFVEN
jgi:hypothetical protein